MYFEKNFCYATASSIFNYVSNVNIFQGSYWSSSLTYNPEKTSLPNGVHWKSTV